MSRTFDELRSVSASLSDSRPRPGSTPDATVADSLNLRPLYFSTRRLARVLGILFVLGAAVGWVAAGYDLGEVRAIRRGAALDATAALAHAAAGERIAVAQIAAAVLIAAAFVPWLYQARANVRALGARRLRFGREWTYLAFVIPVLNTYRPYQIVSEVWRGSDPESVDPIGWQRLQTATFVLAWWVGLVGWVACTALAAILFRFAHGVEQIQTAHALQLAGDVGAAVSASLGYFVVARIAAAQDAKWARLGGEERGGLDAAYGSAVARA
jgi:hypothetical protein